MQQVLHHGYPPRASASKPEQWSKQHTAFAFASYDGQCLLDSVACELWRTLLQRATSMHGGLVTATNGLNYARKLTALLSKPGVQALESRGELLDVFERDLDERAFRRRLCRSLVNAANSSELVRWRDVARRRPVTRSTGAARGGGGTRRTDGTCRFRAARDEAAQVSARILGQPDCGGKQIAIGA